MQRKFFYGTAIAASLVASGLAMIAGAPAAAASSTPGCGTTTNWHWIAQYHSNVLDGSVQSYPTVVVAASDWESTSTAYKIRTKVWGTQAAINAINSGYASDAYPNTGINQITFNQQPNSSTLTFQNSACPGTGTSSIGLWGVTLDYVPYIGSAVSALANYVTIGSNWVVETSNQNEMQWSSPTADRVLPAGVSTTQAENYQGYSQEFVANAEAGYGVKTSGNVEYETSYYADPPVDRYVYYAYNMSGSPTAAGSIEPYQ